MHYDINNHDTAKLSWENIQMPFKTTLFSRACIAARLSDFFSSHLVYKRGSWSQMTLLVYLLV